MNLTIDLIEGNCPVQGYGSVDGMCFYFRARGAGWSFEVHERIFGQGELPLTPPLWETDDDWVDASYMSETSARLCIELAVLRGRAANWGKKE